MAATKTAVTANETEIANAMNVLGLGNFAESLLDEIELDRRLTKSLEQFERGKTFSTEEMEKRTTERLNNGYYLRK